MKRLMGVFGLSQNETPPSVIAIDKSSLVLEPVSPGLRCHLDEHFHGPSGIHVLVGWLHAHDNTTVIFEIQDHFGARHRVDVAASMERRDVVQALAMEGFAALSKRLGFVIAVKGIPDGPVHLVVRKSDRDAELIVSPDRSTSLGTDIQQDLRTLLNYAAACGDPGIYNHLGPVIAELWTYARQPAVPAAILPFGEQIQRPKASLIIPLYGRIDLAEHQLVHFSADPDLADVEILFVLDDPRFVDMIAAQASLWHRLYRMPFQIAISPRNLGYAGANNLGVQLARAGRIVLMNSDVLPAQQGWLSALLQALETIPGAGIVTPLLLYPNGSVQYNGIDFRITPHLAPFMLNEHPGKGLPPPASDSPPHQVQAATGACMAIRRDHYRQHGGFDEAYIVGDFEDSDLSLKMRAAGHTVWCLPSVRLFHLERQSLATIDGGEFRQQLTLFNAWQHHSRWFETAGTGRVS